MFGKIKILVLINILNDFYNICLVLDQAVKLKSGKIGRWKGQVTSGEYFGEDGGRVKE